MLNSIGTNIGKYDASFIMNTLDAADGLTDGKISNTSVWNQFASILNDSNITPENTESTISKLNEFIQNATSELVSALEGFIDGLLKNSNSTDMDSEIIINTEVNTDTEVNTEPQLEFKLSDRQNSELDMVNDKYETNKERYEYVSQKTGIPAELICAIHYRECTLNFKKAIRDGKTTTSSKYWAQNAIQTLNKLKNSFFDYCQKNNIQYEGEHFSSIEEQMDFAEFWNGLGYKRRGRVSPYVYAGTTKYSSGKYVRDGKFNPNVVDQQLGVAVILMTLEYPENNAEPNQIFVSDEPADIDKEEYEKGV